MYLRLTALFGFRRWDLSSSAPSPSSASSPAAWPRLVTTWLKMRGFLNPFRSRPNSSWSEGEKSRPRCIPPESSSSSSPASRILKSGEVCVVRGSTLIWRFAILCFPITFKRSAMPPSVSRFSLSLSLEGRRTVSKADATSADVCQFDEWSRAIWLPNGFGKVIGTTMEACLYTSARVLALFASRSKRLACLRLAWLPVEFHDLLTNPWYALQRVLEAPDPDIGLAILVPQALHIVRGKAAPGIVECRH